MLYSVPLKLKSKNYTLKIGMKQMIEMKRQGIDIASIDSGDVEVIFKLIHVCIIDKDETLTVDNLIDLFDESDMAMFELQDLLMLAIKLGVNKGKEEKKTLK